MRAQRGLRKRIRSRNMGTVVSVSARVRVRRAQDSRFRTKGTGLSFQDRGVGRLLDSRHGACISEFTPSQSSLDGG